jgi:hypothetical protein
VGATVGAEAASLGTSTFCLFLLPKKQQLNSRDHLWVSATTFPPAQLLSLVASKPGGLEAFAFNTCLDKAAKATVASVTCKKDFVILTQLACDL